MKIVVKFNKKRKSTYFQSGLLTLITNEQVHSDLKVLSPSKPKQKPAKKKKTITKKQSIKAHKSNLIRASRVKPKRESKTTYKIEYIN